MGHDCGCDTQCPNHRQKDFSHCRLSFTAPVCACAGYRGAEPGIDISALKQTWGSLLSQVIAHETGHILGLAHTDSVVALAQYNDSIPKNPKLLPIPDLMSPVADASSTAITAGPVPRAEPNLSGIISTTDPLGFTYDMQNSDANLQCGVGLATTGIKSCSGVIGVTNTDFSLASTSATIFNAKILLEQPGTGGDVGASAYGLGRIAAGFDEKIELPISPDDSLALEGALTLGSPDILFDLEAFGLGTATPNLVSYGKPLTETVPEPSSIRIFLAAIVMLTWLNLRTKRRALSGRQ